MLEFGITFKCDMPHDRIIRLAQQAEAAGFSYAWVFDSHVLWQDPYPILTLVAAATRRLRMGTCVTNPAVRDLSVTASLLATLNRISGGRMDLGIGRGDSSRRVMGKRPVTVERLEQAVGAIRRLCAGERVSHDGHEIQLGWSPGQVPPAWVAGYGPKSLAAAGRIGDGIILQFADPDLIDWCLGFARRAAKAEGRDFSSIRVMSAAPVWVASDIAAARDRVRWFPALVSNHIVDLLSRYDRAELPDALTGYVTGRDGYDYLHHAEVGSSNGDFVPDDVVDRFAIVGPPDQQISRLRRLAQAGVTQFNIYLMSGDEESQLAAFAEHVLPAFRDDMGAWERQSS